jgi:hypothetical protein
VVTKDAVHTVSSALVAAEGRCIIGAGAAPTTSVWRSGMKSIIPVAMEASATACGSTGTDRVGTGTGREAMELSAPGAG